MTEKICKLCVTNPADKLNSHIIPKFMSKRLFENTKPRHTISILRNAKPKKIQDTPKENNLLCTSCEKRIEILETYFSRILIDINSLQNATRNYRLISEYGNEVLICEDLNPTLFKLFIFSIIWRSSISTLEDFKSFKLKEEVEEKLRSFLDNNLKLKHDDLMQSLKAINDIPQFHFCIIKPKNKTKGIFTAYKFGEDAYAVFTVDYALFFYTQNLPLISEHMIFSNKGNHKVKIVFGNDENWQKLNQLVISMLVNYK